MLSITAYRKDPVLTAKIKKLTDTEPDPNEPKYADDYDQYLHDSDRFEQQYKNLTNQIDYKDAFDIGYGHFSALRHLLAPAFECHYVHKGYFNVSLEYNEHHTNITALLHFFLHSDCDGEYNQTDIDGLYTELTAHQTEIQAELKLPENLKRYGDYDKTFSLFYDFVKRSHNNHYSWEFL